MSRASKGFADFFPTAPSVLKQKRSRPTESGSARKQTSPVPERRHARDSDNPSYHRQEKRITPHERRRSLDCHDQTPRSTEELDTNLGDLLNGVGSASSTSTNSSLFDTTRTTAYVNGDGIISKSLTPLTNTDLSPANHVKSVSADRTASATRAQSSYQATDHPRRKATQSPAMTSKAKSVRLCARPGPGESRGERLVYDPELDKKLDRSKRKELSRKLEYRPLSKQVSQDKRPNLPPPPCPVNKADAFACRTRGQRRRIHD